MVWKTAFQGGFDGLCGQYAIANAFQICGVKDVALTWRVACKALPAEFWPEGLWKGTNFDYLCVMLDAAMKTREAKKLSISYKCPLIPPLGKEQFKKEFASQMGESNVMCAIVGLNSPTRHWLVVERDGGRLVATDASPESGNDNRRINFGTIRSGKKVSGHVGKLVMDRYDIAFISSGCG